MMRTILLAALLVSVAQPAVAQPAGELPWSVPSDMPVTQMQITFEHRGARLSGTLYTPAGRRARATVIALHGAQAPLRSEPLYRHLTQIMPRLGMAVFLFDRRGSGESTDGGAAPGNFDLLAEDAAAAFERLRREPSLDPDRIGFWGLSQGGWISMLAARREPRAAFAVAISAPMAAADLQMNFAVANILRVQGRPQAVIDRAIRARTAVDDYVRGRIPRAQAAAAEADVVGEPWYRDLYLRGNIDDPEWRRQMQNDPLRALEGSRVPTLVVFGQADPWVPVAPSLAALRERASALPQVTVRVIDGADHGMMIGVPPVQQMDARLARQVAPDAPAYFALLGSWLETVIGPPNHPSGR